MSEGDVGSDIAFLPSNRGGRILIHRQFIFRIHRPKQNGRSVWKCNSAECKARLHLRGDSLEKLVNEHCHEPPGDRVLDRKFFTQRLKERARTELAKSPLKIYKEELLARNTTVEASPHLPKYQSVESAMYNARRSQLPNRKKQERPKKAAIKSPGDPKCVKDELVLPGPHPNFDPGMDHAPDSDEDVTPPSQQQQHSPSTSGIPLWSPTRIQPLMPPEDPGHPEDEFDSFAKHVANQLRQLPLERSLMCQDMINSLLVKERLKFLSEAGTRHMPSMHADNRASCSFGNVQRQNTSASISQNRMPAANMDSGISCRISNTQNQGPVPSNCPTTQVLRDENVTFSLQWLN